MPRLAFAVGEVLPGHIDDLGESSVVGFDLEVVDLPFEVGTRALSSESVTVGGVTIWLGDLALPREDPFRFFLDLGRMESEERLRGLGGVTNP